MSKEVEDKREAKELNGYTNEILESVNGKIKILQMVENTKGIDVVDTLKEYDDLKHELIHCLSIPNNADKYEKYLELLDDYRFLHLESVMLFGKILTISNFAKFKEIQKQLPEKLDENMVNELCDKCCEIGFNDVRVKKKDLELAKNRFKEVINTNTDLGELFKTYAIQTSIRTFTSKSEYKGTVTVSDMITYLGVLGQFSERCEENTHIVLGLIINDDNVENKREYIQLELAEGEVSISERLQDMAIKTTENARFKIELLGYGNEEETKETLQYFSTKLKSI